MIELLGWASHAASALPLLVCVLLLLRNRDPSHEAWVLAAACFVSFIADQVGAQLASRGQTNWWLGYVYAPVQLGMMAWVAAPRPAVRTVALFGIGLCAVVSVLRGTLGEPETMVKIVGGAVVGWLVYGVPTLTRFRAGLWLYCVATMPWVMAMAVIPYNSAWWDPSWVLYQGTRIAGLLLLTRALVRKEDSHGRRTPEDRTQRERWHRDFGGRDRHVVEATGKR